jgi:hypothetical protein
VQTIRNIFFLKGGTFIGGADIEDSPQTSSKMGKPIRSLYHDSLM